MIVFIASLICSIKSQQKNQKIKFQGSKGFTTEQQKVRKQT